MDITTVARGCSLCRYEIEPEQLFRPELGEYHTYGVRITSSDFTDILHDISVCKKTSEHIVELLNRHQVSPLHLFDVVTDLLP